MDYLTEFEFWGRIWGQFLGYLDGQPPGVIYFLLFCGAFMENVVPPIPGDTLIVFGAYLAGIGMIGVVPAYLAMWAGSSLGCLLVYGVAYLKGREILLWLKLRWLTGEHLDRTERLFGRYGDRVVILNRFLPTVRAFVGIVAGLSRMHPLRMALLVLLATFLWNSLLVYFGFTVGENWQRVVGVLRTYNRVVFISMAAAIAVYWFWHRRRSARQPASPSSEETPDPMDRCA